MGRTDDERPAIEIVGADPPTTSLQHVSTRGPGGPRRRGIRVLLVAASVVGLLIVGLALGGDDDGPPAPDEQAGADEETTTTRPRSTTTRPTTTTASTTTTTTGPLFAGQPLSGWLLSGNVSGWTLVDIATGARLETALPFDDPYSTRSVAGGVVTIVAGNVEYHDLRVAEAVREPVVLGPADQVLLSGLSDQVWLLQGTYEDGSSTSGRARLVDLEGRQLRSFGVPIGSYVAATADGVLFDRGGRVYRADEAGVEDLAVGDLIGVAGSSPVIFTCDVDASCGIELLHPSGERIRRLAIDHPSIDLAAEISSDALGRFAIVTYGPEDGPLISLFDPDGALLATVEDTGFFGGPLTWLPGDAGLVGTREGRIVWVHQAAEGWVVEDLLALAPVQSDGVLAISS